MTGKQTPPIQSLRALLDTFNETGVFAPHAMQQAQNALRTIILQTINTNAISEDDFKTVVTAACFLLEEEEIIDTFVCSPMQLRGMCHGQPMPGEFARLSLVFRLEPLVEAILARPASDAPPFTF